jgi:hypothetical protein
MDGRQTWQAPMSIRNFAKDLGVPETQHRSVRRPRPREIGISELQSIHVLLRSSDPNGPQAEPPARDPSRL